MRRVRFTIALFSIAAATPALAEKYFAVTPSAQAEMDFPEIPDTVVGKISGKCIDQHWVVTSSTRTELICESPLNTGQSVLGQMLLGNSYSTPPRRFYRFNVAEVSGVSRVQASGWMELQMAFGQTKRDEFSGPDFQNSIMAFLATAGGAYPVGTTFPNHAVMGVTVADFNEGGTQGLKVTAIPPDSAAAKAGMQIGDVVTRIANKRLRSFADYLSATAKAAESPTYPVDIIRNGNAMTLTFDRAFRPAITQQIAPHSPEAASQVPGAPRSVADELTKLAKLRSDGVLTDAEFQAQKMKLLGQ